MKSLLTRFCALAAIAMPALVFAGAAGIPPQANTVPFVASNPTAPHTSWSGNPVTLKGTLTADSSIAGDTFTYDWNPGDGITPHCTGQVMNPYDIECPVAYTGAVGTVRVAVLTITDTTTGLVSPVSNCAPGPVTGSCYYTALEAPPPNLSVEVNNAIDNGLWYLHTHMQRHTSGGGAPIGDWYLCDGSDADACSAGGSGASALDCAAFEDSGFLQTNSPWNPYSDDVRLCLNGVFDELATIGISTVNDATFGSFNPDSNGNGIGVEHNGYPENYQTGMMLDAVVAAGVVDKATAVTPGTALATSAAGKGSGPSHLYTYQDAVFDMVDDYAYCQAITDPGWAQGGGWHYSCQEETGDNSVSQWAAIGIIPAIRNFGATVPAELHVGDTSWLDVSFTANSPKNGYFGYTSNTPIWGPYADTPSGMVQLAMNGLGTGKTTPGGNLSWDSAATFLRDSFATQDGSAEDDLKDYYYGMFSFTKAMLLHDNSGTGLVPSPLSLLESLDDPGTCASPVPDSALGSGSGPCYPPIDWYAAQTAAYGGTDPTDGVARTLVLSQNGGGSWFGHNVSGSQYYLETASAIIMLNKTVFQPVPVACFTANPAHVASGGPVTLDGRCSVEQNPANTLVSWAWNVDGTASTTNFSIQGASAQCLLKPSCSEMIANFTLPVGKTLPYNYPVRLRITDSAGLTADVVGFVVIANPPNPPNANAGGPYNFCPNMTAAGKPVYSPFMLDGSKSTNPDQGKTDGSAGSVPSTIVSYKWDYACSGLFTSASGAQVDATAAFDQPAYYGTNFNVCLQVTNNDNLAFPTSGLTAGLASVASAQVSIHQATDETCTHCVFTLGGKAKAPTPSVPGNIQLYWADTNTSPTFPIDHYNVYRSLSPTFSPFTQIAGAASSPFVPAVQVSNPAGGTLNLLDANVIGGTTYYYRIAPATVNDTETCQGNVTITVALAKGR